MSKLLQASTAQNRMVEKVFDGNNPPFSIAPISDPPDYQLLIRWMAEGELLELHDSDWGGVIGYIHAKHYARIPQLCNAAIAAQTAEENAFREHAGSEYPTEPGDYWVKTECGTDVELTALRWQDGEWRYNEAGPEHLWYEKFGQKVISWVSPGKNLETQAERTARLLTEQLQASRLRTGEFFCEQLNRKVYTISSLRWNQPISSASTEDLLAFLTQEERDKKLKELLNEKS